MKEPSVKRHKMCSAVGSKLSRGFTLLELIIVIILAGVLAVTAASRFQGKSGFDSVSLQNRTLSALRQMQLRAMQDTRSGFCHQINFNTASAAIGPPSNDYSDGNQANTCLTSISSSTADYLRIDNADFVDLGASLQVVNDGLPITTIGFDGLGRPVNESRSRICGTDCTVTLTTDSSSSVCVNSEGYIRAC